MNDLAREGYLVRRRGSGTYVSDTAPVLAKRAFGIVWSSFAASLHTPFQRHLLTGLEHHLRELDWRIGVMTTDGFESAHNPGQALAETARQQAYDGLFIVSPLPELWLEQLHASGMPLVAINVEFSDVLLPRIMMDPARLVREACHYLFTLGHRRLAILLGRMPGIDPTAPSIARSGAEEAERIRDERGDSVQLTCAFYDYNDHDSFEKAAAPLLLARTGEQATAVILGESEVATVFEKRARAAGLTIPDDVSVVVIDKGPPYSTFTAVETQIDNLCWRAVRIMEGLLAGYPPTRRRELVGCDLVVRASTAPPPTGEPAGLG